MSEHILCSIDDGVATLTLNRPDKLNALTAALFHELDAHLDAIEAHDVACVLLTGAGRSFCAGHDLDDVANVEDTMRFENGVIERLASLPVPVIAAVRGHCLTGGLELALAAEIIIASDSAKFADTHAKWDLVPVWGLSQRLPRRVGTARAKEMMYASRTYNADAACKMGLANFVVPDADLDAEARRFCNDIKSNSRRAVRALKKLVDQTEDMRLSEGIAWELHHTEGVGPELQERLDRMRKK